jgi:hypothetical protein
MTVAIDPKTDSQPEAKRDDQQTTNGKEADPEDFGSVQEIVERPGKSLDHGYLQRVEILEGIGRYVKKQRKIDPGDRARIEEVADELRRAPTVTEDLDEAVRSEQEVHKAWENLHKDLEEKG